MSRLNGRFIGMLIFIIVAMILIFQVVKLALHSDTIEINSDHIKQDLAQIIYDGNVVISKERLTLRADSVIFRSRGVFQGKYMLNGNPAEFEKDISSSRSVKGSAKIIHYDPVKNHVLLMGDATITENGKTVNNHSLSYDLNFHTYY